MQSFTNIIFDKKPDDVTIYQTSVYVIESCKEIQVVDKRSKVVQIKFQCDVKIFEVNEYIIHELKSRTQNDTSTYDELAIALQEGVDSV